MDRDLNYSGSIPTATTLIPDLYVFHDTLANAEPVNLGSTDQGSVLVVTRIQVEFKIQPEVVPSQLLLRLVAQEP